MAKQLKHIEGILDDIGPVLSHTDALGGHPELEERTKRLNLIEHVVLFRNEHTITFNASEIVLGGLVGFVAGAAAVSAHQRH